MANRIVRDPIYQQLNELLRNAIRTRRFKPGEKFLTEREIVQEFGVSRATANKALSNLVAEGVLEFKKGVGTFVRGGIIDYDLRELVSFTSKAHAVGKKPSTEVLLFELTTAGQVPGMNARDTLRVSADEVVYLIERLRLVDSEPVIFEHRCIVTRYCPNLTADDVAGSLYAAWAEKYRLEIVGADQTIRAVGLDARAASLLHRKRGGAAFQVTSTGFLAGGAPLWCERTLFRGDAYEFHNRLGPLQTARPAAGSLVDIVSSK